MDSCSYRNDATPTNETVAHRHDGAEEGLAPQCALTEPDVVNGAFEAVRVVGEGELRAHGALESKAMCGVLQ